MYCEYFGFSERPFDVTPDPRFLYLSSAHREMLASLVYGIKERRGFITIVGEVGTGKTTLLNAMLDKLDKTTKIAFVFNTAVTFEQMLHLALIDLGLTKSEAVLTKVEALHILNDYAIKQLSEGNKVVIVVDEAQNLDSLAMENFRLLSNLETRKNKLIQIILSGQPELDVKLRRKELRQLAQRINLRRYITPLDEKEMEEYIQHRLKVVGYKGKPIFSQRALQGVWEFSGGIPRKINVLCDNTFLIAYGLERKKITGGIVEEAINDLSWSPYAQNDVENKISKPDLPLIYNNGQNRSEDILSAVPASFSIKNKRKSSHQYTRIAKFIIIISIGLGIGYAFGRFIPFWKSVADRDSSNLHIYESRDENKMNVEKEGSSISDELVSRAQEVEEIQRLAMQQESSVGGSSPEEIIGGGNEISEEVREKKKEIEAADEDNEISKLNSDETLEKLGINDGIPARFRVVKKNDLLSEIIRQEYGTYNDLLLEKILKTNPEIRNPNEIYIGQVISLPILSKY